ncbi:unnamed protein product [Oikopleura dioica]|uniref:PID domain-containing protein n=1 Tax=Oikopleura dioica TaxID=34765 RepID=E4X024_OIKDI|nr:unnamed protein product [Oikopleura dioica]
MSSSLSGVLEGSQLNHSGRWTTAGEVFPVRQLGSTEIVTDTNFSSELQNAIRRLSRNIPRSSTSFSLGYRPLIKDSPDEDDCGQTRGQQSDAYLVVEAEQIRVIDPVTRAILETIKLSSIRVWAAHQLDIGVVARVGSTDMALVFRCETDAKRCRRCDPRQLLAPGQRNQDGQRKAAAFFYSRSRTIQPVSSQSEWTPANALISATTLLLKSSPPADLLSSKSSPCNGELSRVRLRYLSFMAIGNDARMFGFIHLIGPEEYRCHVLCCDPSAIELSQALQEACVLRYQKAVEAKNQRLAPACHHPESSLQSILGASKRGFGNLMGAFRRHTTTTSNDHPS